MPQREKSSAPAFNWRVRVYYEDTDASGVVYHAQYLKYFERARTEWLRALGYGQARLAEELSLAFTVVSVSVAFRQPARLDDALEVGVAVADTRRASLCFEQAMHRNGTLIASGTFRVACVDATSFRPRAIPEDLLREMR